MLTARARFTAAATLVVVLALYILPERGHARAVAEQLVVNDTRPVEVTCAVTGFDTYANGDAKLTVRCPPSQIVKESVIRTALVSSSSPLGYPLSELAGIRSAAARLTQAILAGRRIVEHGYAHSVPISMTALQRDAIVRTSEAILGAGATVGVFDAVLNMLRNGTETTAELQSVVQPVQQWAEAWLEAMKAPNHEGLLRLGLILRSTLEPVR